MSGVESVFQFCSIEMGGNDDFLGVSTFQRSPLFSLGS